jgi:Major Facilitator Superfamily
LDIEIRNKSPLAAAVQFVPMGVSFILASAAGGVIFGKIPTKLIFATASVFEIIAGALMTQVGHQSYWKFFFPAVLFAGMGTALFMATFINVVANSAPLKHQGLVSGVCMTGGLLGTSIALAIGTSEVGSAVELKGYHDAYYTLVAYGGISLLISIFFIKNHKGKVGDQRNIDSGESTDTTVASVNSLSGEIEEPAKDGSGTDAGSNKELVKDEVSKKV